MVAKIFISYRRADVPGFTQAIYNELLEYFPKRNIFLDIDGLKSGDTFAEVIGTKLAEANIVLAIIGNNWVSDRLNNPDDWVRREIAQGLEQGHTVVIPILVQQATLPKKADLPKNLQKMPDIEVHEIRGNVNVAVQVAPLAKLILKKTSWFYWPPKLRARRAIVAGLILFTALVVLVSMPEGGIHIDRLSPHTPTVAATALPTLTPAPTATTASMPSATNTAALPTATNTLPPSSTATKTGGGLALTPQALQTLESHIGAVADLAITTHAQGDVLLASGGEDRIIRLWNLNQMDAEPAYLNKHSADITSLIFSPDGSKLVSADEAGVIYLWDMALYSEAGYEPAVFVETNYAHKDLAFSPDGNYLAVSSENTFTIYNIRNAKDIFYQEKDPDTDYETAVYTPNGVFIFFPFSSHIYLINTSNVDNKLWLGEDIDYVRVLVIADNNTLASATLKNEVTVWHGNSPTQLSGHTDTVQALAFSSDTILLASGSTDEIMLWDSDSGVNLHTLTPLHKSVRALRFSPDGRYLIAAGDDGVISVWHLPQIIATYFTE